MSGVQVAGSARLRQRIQTLQRGMPRLVEQTQMQGFLLRRIRARFLQQVGPDLVPWEALKSSSKKGKSILRQKENLYRGIQVMRGQTGLASPTGAGFAIGVVDKTITETFVGLGGKSTSRTRSLAWYARLHQNGNRATNLPRRRFLGISRLDVKAVDSLLRRALVRLVQES